MTEEDRVLLEQHTTFRMMDFNKGLEYLNFLLNSYDFSNPLFGREGFLKNNLVMIDMCPDKEGIYFSGAVSVLTEKGYENRCITGYIYDEKKGLVIDMNVYRLGLSEEDNTKEYNVSELYERNKDGESFKRYSSYRSVNGIESHLEKKYFMDSKYLEEYIASKTNSRKF